MSMIVAPARFTRPVTYLPTISTPREAVYALTPMVEGYTGPLYSACSTAAGSGVPGTSVDVYADADGGADETAAVAAFGTTYAIWRAYDQEGNHGPAEQLSYDARPYTSATSRLGQVNFRPQSEAWPWSWLELPSTISTSRQGCTWINISGGNNGYGGAGEAAIASLGVDDVTAAVSIGGRSLGPAGGLSTRTNLEYATALPQDTQATFTAIVMSPSAFKVWRDAQSSSTAAASAATMLGGFWGKGAFQPASYGVRNYGMVIYKDVLSDGDIATLRTPIKTIFGITDRTVNILCDGDSIMLGGSGGDNCQNRLYHLIKLGLTSAYLYNTGHGGAALDVATNRTDAWMAARYRADCETNIYYTEWGINNVGGDQTWEEITTRFSTLYESARDAGFTVVAETLLPFGYSGSKETARLGVNAWLRANDGPSTFYLVDHGDAGTDVTLDGTNHPTSAGYLKIAQNALPVLTALL